MDGAVAQLLQGIADVDPVAVVAVVDPAEAGDPGRADAAYDELGSRVLRIGEEVPPDVTAVLRAAEGQVGGTLDGAAIATLAAVDLELEGLDLLSDIDGDRALVLIADGVIRVDVDPGRLPDEVVGLAAASYDMPLTEGWRADGGAIDPVLATVQRDGRWYVSLEATADHLLGGGS